MRKISGLESWINDMHFLKIYFLKKGRLVKISINIFKKICISHEEISWNMNPRIGATLFVKNI